MITQIALFSSHQFNEEAKQYCASLQKTRILQTATHSTATEGPTFLALHYLALMGLPPRETYFVGAYSGVSFANSAWSGCLNYSNRFDLETIISSQATQGILDSGDFILRVETAQNRSPSN